MQSPHHDLTSIAGFGAACEGNGKVKSRTAISDSWESLGAKMGPTRKARHSHAAVVTLVHVDTQCSELHVVSKCCNGQELQCGQDISGRVMKNNQKSHRMHSIYLCIT